LVEGILNLIYPLADLALFLFVLSIFFSYQEGKFSLPWQIIALGFLTIGFSDLLYAFTTWNDFYYPDGSTNFISFLTDYTYTISYLMMAVGFFVFSQLLQTSTLKAVPVETHVEPQLSTAQEYFLICTNNKHQIILMSQNIFYLLHINPADHSKPDFNHLFQMDEDQYHDLFASIEESGFINNKEITITDYSGQKITAQINAVASYNLGQKYTGANIAISMPANLHPDYQLPSDYHMSIINKVKEQTGVRDAEYFSYAKYYFRELIIEMHYLVKELAGRQISDQFIHSFNNYAIKNNWSIQFKDSSVSISNEILVQDFKQASQALIKYTKQFTTEMISQEIMHNQIENFNKQIDRHILNAATEYGLSQINQEVF
jgi:hypothetical protein